MKSERIKKLEKAVAAGYKARAELNKIDAKTKDRQNKALIGRCFRFKNSYGGGCDPWWLYIKVTGTEGGYLKTFQFQKQSDGCIEIVQDRINPSMDSDYRAIDNSEFDQAWKEILKELSQIEV